MIAKVCEVVSILKLAVIGFLITCGVVVVVKGQGMYFRSYIRVPQALCRDSASGCMTNNVAEKN